MSSGCELQTFTQTSILRVLTNQKVGFTTKLPVKKFMGDIGHCCSPKLFSPKPMNARSVFIFRAAISPKGNMSFSLRCSYRASRKLNVESSRLSNSWHLFKFGGGGGSLAKPPPFLGYLRSYSHDSMTQTARCYFQVESEAETSAHSSVQNLGSLIGKLYSSAKSIVESNVSLIFRSLFRGPRSSFLLSFLLEYPHS